VLTVGRRCRRGRRGVDSRFDDTRLGGGSLGRAIGEVGSTARGTARRGRRQLGVGVDLRLDFLMLVVVDVVVAPGSGLSSASLSPRRGSEQGHG